jgi:hypothetical protein
MFCCAVGDVGDVDGDVDLCACNECCGKVVVGYRSFNRSNDICHVRYYHFTWKGTGEPQGM